MKWVKRWEVPKSDGVGYWIVAIDEDSNYGCSCPVWKFRRQECHHIRLVKEGHYEGYFADQVISRIQNQEVETVKEYLGEN